MWMLIPQCSKTTDWQASNGFAWSSALLVILSRVDGEEPVLSLSKEPHI